ncbi:hypothetical protein VL04_17810 [Chromobacterium violaceum]|uniref:hypothetical protein n=1 Tax=Chromobacterium violaceum TaxID=536 RepID=UPI00065416E2|nr:hypothetical protein [Chromobacterium violaceum]KMN50447.1 hypothetical protein VK93_06520 [Chromobacterium violaceum]KMN85455.1 hypothetical protein VL02_14200 [Chromobacterium violaceum]KMN88912.1 hypothetical protein VL04_17810 [Chromobacterium violaceum]KMO04005.1 hypothetical protein VL16_10525 [Chromobacterium violaceum]MBX9269358.1 hypothetical protein [Chromobacterium violaceum]
MKIIVDLQTKTVAGVTVDGYFEAGKNQALIAPPEGFDPEAMGDYTFDGASLVRDAQAALSRAKAARKARIKQEAARLIEADDWKLQRAREREAAGWGTLAEVDAALAGREAIRRSSNAAEQAVDALTDAASVQAFTWTVDVAVAVPRRLTHKQFMARFTDAEMQGMLKAFGDNPALRPWWERFSLARDISLDDPATQAGVQALEAAGLIGKGRAGEVLASAQAAV